jgi:glycosyltransferase involved in cell wall biosynthesis
MKLSVIIPCFNAEDTIAIQMDALANQSWSEPWEVVVANNKSTDNSMGIVEGYKKQLPNLRTVDASVRQGQPYALNVGAACAQGEAIAFCDADDEVAPGWVAAMGEALSKYDFVACRVDTEKLNPPWIYAALGALPQREGLQTIWYPPYLLHAGGGTLGVKRSLHDAIGGFDETLPYLHDTDYCFRLQLRGVQLHFVKDACTCVRFRDKLSAIFHQARHWAEYNVKVYKKYRLLTGTKVSEPWKRYLSKWDEFVKQVPLVRQKKDVALLFWNLGWQIGLLQGSIKHRIHPVPF